eukprot:scaffold76172_cov57-Phaeocystis_antarctica.AAC.1
MARKHMAHMKYMARRGSSVLHSWPRMVPCSSPLSFDNAIAAPMTNPFVDHVLTGKRAVGEGCKGCIFADGD